MVMAIGYEQLKKISKLLISDFGDIFTEKVCPGAASSAVRDGTFDRWIATIRFFVIEKLQNLENIQNYFWTQNAW